MSWVAIGPLSGKESPELNDINLRIEWKNEKQLNNLKTYVNFNHLRGHYFRCPKTCKQQKNENHNLIFEIKNAKDPNIVPKYLYVAIYCFGWIECESIDNVNDLDYVVSEGNNVQHYWKAPDEPHNVGYKVNENLQCVNPTNEMWFLTHLDYDLGKDKFLEVDEDIFVRGEREDITDSNLMIIKKKNISLHFKVSGYHNQEIELIKNQSKANCGEYKNVWKSLIHQHLSPNAHWSDIHKTHLLFLQYLKSQF